MKRAICAGFLPLLIAVVSPPIRMAAQVEPIRDSSSSSSISMPEATRHRAGNAPLKGALIGAGVGAATGLVFYEVVDAQLDIGFCREGEPNCTTKQNYSRRGMVLGFGAVGAAVGLAIGSRYSSREQQPRSAWRLHLGNAPHAAHKPAMILSHRF